MNRLTLTILTLSLISCAIPPRHYLTTPAGANASRDTLTCRQMAMQEATMNGLQGNMFVEISVGRATNECLASLGYR